MFILGKPKFTKPLEEKNDVDEGQTLNLSVNVQANPAPQIKWYEYKSAKFHSFFGRINFIG